MLFSMKYLHKVFLCLAVLIILIWMFIVYSLRDMLLMSVQFELNQTVPVHYFDTLREQQDCVRRQQLRYRSWRYGVVTIVRPEIKRNCSKILSGDREELRRIKLENAQWSNSVRSNESLIWTGNCSTIHDYFRNNLYTTRLERSFPLAYSIGFHSDYAEQVVRLFRYLYRPHNLYCFYHSNDEEAFSKVVKDLAWCLDNVLLPWEIDTVRNAGENLVKMQMGCLQELLRKRKGQQNQWQYLISLSGRELPLTSTHQITSFLKGRNRSSSLVQLLPPKPEATTPPAPLPDGPSRSSITLTLLSYTLSRLLSTFSADVLMEHLRRYSEFDEDVVILEVDKESLGITMRRDDHSSVPFLNYFLRTEHFNKSNSSEVECFSGHYRGDVCVVGLGDLADVLRYSQGALFHSEYSMRVDHTVMDCMEERLVAINKEEFLQDCKNLHFSDKNQFVH